MTGEDGAPGAQISAAALRRARDEFAHLLQQRTPERRWQTFFSDNPHVLSTGLPLQLLPCDILPLGRPGRTEPDFLIHPGSLQSRRIHGIVELKTRHARVTTRGRKPELVLSREAAIAERQLRTYDRLYDSFAPEQRLLALETLSHLFVIMGSSDELVTLEDQLRPQLREILPPGIRFLTFDELFRSYSAEVPKPVSLLRRAMLSAPEVVSWLSFAREGRAKAKLHRVVAEVYDGFDLGGSRPRELDFRRWAELLFSRPPSFPARFQPPDRPVLHATEQYQAALAEFEVSRRGLDGEAPLNRHRYRHFRFAFEGRVASLPSNPAILDLLRQGDIRASQMFAQQAFEQGFDAVSYPSAVASGRVYAIFNLDAVGKMLESRLVDIRAG